MAANKGASSNYQPSGDQDSWAQGLSDLSQALEAAARSSPQQPAFYLRDPRSKGESAQYLSLNFADLLQERDGWFEHLKEQSVSSYDRALIDLPLGIALISVVYALFKIGAEVILVDKSYDWKTGYRTMIGLKPSILIGTTGSVKRAKKWMKGAGEIRLSLTVANATRRMARSGEMAEDAGEWPSRRSSSTLTLARSAESRAGLSARFTQKQLVSILQATRRRFSVKKGEVDLPNCPMLAIVNAAGGVASVVVEDRFSKPVSLDERQTIDAILDLEATSVMRELQDWRSLARYCLTNKIALKSLKRVFVANASPAALRQLEAVRGILSEAARLYLVHRSIDSPLVSAIDCTQPTENSAASFGVCLGKPLPGVEARVDPIPGCDFGEAAESPFDTRPKVGELLLSGDSVGGSDVRALDAADRGWSAQWMKTGTLAGFDPEGRLWICGQVRDLIATSLGWFVPVRCEAVFAKHPKAVRVSVVALKRKGRTRPGLIVETAPGDLPRKPLELSKFKAELLQLGAASDETRFIVDIFFGKSLPRKEGDAFEIDRHALSKRYSRRLRT